MARTQRRTRSVRAAQAKAERRSGYSKSGKLVVRLTGHQRLSSKVRTGDSHGCRARECLLLCRAICRS
eukprot:6199874-Pleurochrysis_carterae.AAC.2